MTRLVQIQEGLRRRVALVDEPRLRLLADFATVHELAEAALARGLPLTALIASQATGETLDYDQVYLGQSPWRLLAPIDHPGRTRALPGLRHRPHPSGQRQEPPGDARGQPAPK